MISLQDNKTNTINSYILPCFTNLHRARHNKEFCQNVRWQVTCPTTRSSLRQHNAYKAAVPIAMSFG